MKKKFLFLLAPVFALLFITAALIFNEVTDQYTPVKAQNGAAAKAPDFKALDMQGNEITLSQFAGKPVVVNFWATWCPPCKAELPHFDQAAAKHKDNIAFLMVNLTDGSRDTVDGVKNFISAGGYTFPVYFDTTLSSTRAYGISSIPMTVFIAPDGSVVARHLGSMDAATLNSYIAKLHVK